MSRNNNRSLQWESGAGSRVVVRGGKRSGRAFIDITGEVFGLLTVVERLPSKWGMTQWKCRCVCGAIREVGGKNLRDGRSRSCGCGTQEFQMATKEHRGDAPVPMTPAAKLAAYNALRREQREADRVGRAAKNKDPKSAAGAGELVTKNTESTKRAADDGMGEVHAGRDFGDRATVRRVLGESTKDREREEAMARGQAASVKRAERATRLRHGLPPVDRADYAAARVPMDRDGKVRLLRTMRAAGARWSELTEMMEEVGATREEIGK